MVERGIWHYEMFVKYVLYSDRLMRDLQVQNFSDIKHSLFFVPYYMWHCCKAPNSEPSSV